MFLDCPQCQQRYIRPRLLPCGQSLCSFCIKVATVDFTDEFRCDSCGNIHLVPENGFPIDHKLIEELNKKPSTSSEINFFKTILNQIKQKLKQVESDLNIEEYLIIEYCNELRRQVQLAKELEIEELHKLSDQMISEIDNFEKDKLYCYSNKAKFTAQLNEMKEMLSKCNENLIQTELSYQILEDLQSKLKTEKEKLEKILLKQFKIEEKIDDLEPSVNEMKDFLAFQDYFSEFYNEIFVSDAIEKDQSYVDFNCVCLEPNSFIVFLFPNQHMEVNNQIKCFILDENKTIEKVKRIDIEYNQIKDFKSSSKKICFNYRTRNRFYLCVLSNHLEILKLSESVFAKGTLIGANDKNLFIEFRLHNRKNKLIVIMDWSLKIVKKVRQGTNPSEKFYFGDSSIDCFQFIDDKYYVNSSGGFSIIDSNNGLLLYSIETEKGLVHVDTNSRLILIKTDSIQYINQNGFILKKVEIADRELHLCGCRHWSIDEHKNIYYELKYEQKTRRLYILSIKL